MKYVDINLLEVIWQVLARSIGYEDMINVCQNLITDTRIDGRLSQNLIFLFNKSFYEAQKKIASRCREEIIKQSIMTLYRGVITYQPPQNDYEIKNIENKIQSLTIQLKNIEKIRQNGRQKFAHNIIEELLTQLFKLNDRSSLKTQEYIDKLIEEAEKDCNAKFYKNTLRDKEFGLRKELYDIFFTEIEENQELNNIFGKDLLPLRGMTTIRINNLPTRHVIKKLDGKLFSAPVKPIPVRPGTSWRRLRYGKKTVDNIQDNANFTEAQRELKSNLSPEVLEKSLQDACNLESDLWRAKKIGELAPNLPPKLLKQALETVFEMKSELWRANALGDLAPYLSTKLLEQAFDTISNIKSELWRVKAMSKLAPHLTPKLLEKALKLANGIKSEYSRTRALEELAPYLPPEE